MKIHNAFRWPLILSVMLGLLVVSSACSTVRPRPLPPLPKGSSAELQGSYKGTQQAYEACAQQDVDAQVPWQLYAGATSAGVGVIAVASAAGLMAVPNFDVPTRAGIAGGLGSLALISGGFAAVFAGQTLQQWSREGVYKQQLKSASKRSINAIAAADNQALMNLTREINEDCRMVQNSNGHDAALSGIADLNRWRKASQKAEQDLATLQQKLSENARKMDAAEARRAQLQQNLDKLQNDFSQSESENNRLQSALNRLEEEQASLSKRQKKLLEEKRKLEQKNNHYEEVAQALAKEVKDGRVALRRLRNGVIVEMPNKILFPSGSADLNPVGQETLSAVATAIKNIKDRRISIEGHTDNVPVGKKLKWTSNWELSSARAITVTMFLQEQGVNPSLMSANARSQYAPLTSNAKPEGRARNRRIEIYLLPKPEAAASVVKVSKKG